MECKSLIRGKQGMDQTKKEALTSSLAVFPGYLVVGIAFGLLAQQHQIGWGWALMMSVLVYAGSMQFVGIQLLAQAASPAGRSS